MDADLIMDRLAELGAWIQPPAPECPRWRVHEPPTGLPDELREEILDNWTAVQGATQRRQAEAVEVARNAAMRRLTLDPTQREEAINAACKALLPAVLERGVDVPGISLEELLKAPSATAGAINGETDQ